MVITNQFLKEYQAFTRSVNINQESFRYAYLITNLTSEAGEVSGLFAKMLRDGTSPEIYDYKMKKELGDVLWHVSELCNEHGWSLEEVIQANINKLSTRVNNNTINGSGDDR